MKKSHDMKYLSVEGEIVKFGSEADMINLAAQYDSDYELLDREDLTSQQLVDVFELEETAEEDE